MGASINYFDFEKRCKLYDDANRSDITNEFVWGSRIVKIGSTYHAYIEHWTNVDGINGYAYYGKIYHASSLSPLGPFDTGRTELTDLQGITGTAGAFVNGDPIVIGSTIYLFFTGTTAETPTYPIVGTPARNNQRVYCAYTDISTPAGPFTLHPTPMVVPRAGKWDELFTNNSSTFVMRNGMYGMVYKSCTIAAPTVLNLGIATATNILGPWTQPETALPITNIEDPFVWREGEFYFMLVKAQDSTYVPVGNGVLLYSKTGEVWTMVTTNTRGWRLTTPIILLTSALRTRMERPFVLVVNGSAVSFSLVILSTDGLTSFNNIREIKQ